MCTNYDTHTEFCRYIVTVNDQASALRTSYLTPWKLLFKNMTLWWFWNLKDSQKEREQFPAFSLIPVSRGCLSTGAEGRLSCVFSLQFRVPRGAGSGFTPDWSSCPQRITLKENTFPLPALSQEVAGPQEFLRHFNCGSHSSLGTLICHFTACWQKSSSANSKKPQC